MPFNRGHQRLARAFTLIEMLLVIAIIAVLSKVVITQIASSTERTRLILSRQQQVALQSAINSWVSGSSTASLSSIRTSYNNASTARAKLDLVQSYLDTETYNHIVSNTSDNAKLQSDAMKRAGKWIELPTWDASSYPRVNLLPVD